VDTLVDVLHALSISFWNPEDDDFSKEASVWVFTRFTFRSLLSFFLATQDFCCSNYARGCKDETEHGFEWI